MFFNNKPLSDNNIFWSSVHYSEVHFRDTLCLDNVHELLPKNQGWHFGFCKVPEDFPDENFLICAPAYLGETKRICNSSCSGITDLVLSSALSKLKTTEKFKI